jgi:hypothetical protein
MNITVNKIQKAILSGNEFFHGIKLPKKQTGTCAQQSSYALLKAREIFESYLKTVAVQKNANHDNFQQIINNFLIP